MGDSDELKRIERAIDQYIDKTCAVHKCTREEAKQLIWVKLASEYYHENPPKDELISVKKEDFDVDCGCC